MFAARLLTAICAVLTGASALGQQTLTLTNPMPGCGVGGAPAVIEFNGDIRIAAGGVTLKCNTTIIAKGGDIYIDNPVFGYTPHTEPRPDGQDGFSSYSLTLITRCGPRAISADPIDPVMPGPPLPLLDIAGIGEPVPADGGNDLIAAPRQYCGSIHLLSPVWLAGEYGTDGRQAESAGTGYAGGNGGNGGAFTAESAKDINASSIIDTSGGQGGSGGMGGPLNGCNGGAGQGNGGWGAAGGNAGPVTLKHGAGSTNTAVIRIGSGLYRYIVARGGNSGNGGVATLGAQGGCGGVAGAGGSAANGGSGGAVMVEGFRVESGAHPDYFVIDSGGGRGGSAGPGSGAAWCAPQFTTGGDGDPNDPSDPEEPEEPFCYLPVHGGPAGDAGSGGNAGAILVRGYGTPLGASDLGTLQGSLSTYASGGQGGQGASGGSAGGINCNGIFCCGSGGFSQAGAPGGNGANTTYNGTRVYLSAFAVAIGGNGGSGTPGSCGTCGPCDCEQGGVGGPGGNGGNLFLIGNDPLGTWVTYALWGGCGGAGGMGYPGAPCAMGGLHGQAGSVSNSMVPPATVAPYGAPCDGTRGPYGPGMTCDGDPIPC